MSKKSKIQELADDLSYRSGGSVLSIYQIKPELRHLASKTIQNYLELPLSVQMAVKLSYEISGTFGTKVGKKGGFVFQMSHGTQQIKKYDPKIYKKNSENTPLRKRSRLIMQQASQFPLAERKDKVRELYKTMPYNLSQTDPVKLRMKNFYFDRETQKDDRLMIYRATDPYNPNPDTDTFVAEKNFSPNRTIPFEFDNREEEYYYAVNSRTGERSNLLHFIWESDFDPVIVKKNNNSRGVISGGQSMINNGGIILSRQVNTSTIAWKINGKKDTLNYGCNIRKEGFLGVTLDEKYNYAE
ncbi:MAG: hypothetical protein WCX83_01400 [Candidatus Cloacimonas sp.]|jgi:hypothetical protein|nr:hypothetical protein [Candidatus Cloacimonadota bacterium]